MTKVNIKDTCIIIDFDKTITLGKVSGVSVPSVISILRSEGHIGEDYTSEAYALQAKYRPIEDNHNLPFETRYKAMENWWTEHMNILIKYGLNYNHIKIASESPQIVIRNGFRELVEFTDKNNIPMIIFSASGIGYEPIELVLKRENLITTPLGDSSESNITIVSNRFIFDESGMATSRLLPTIHSLAKTGDMLKSTNAWPKIKDKKSAIVIGDALHDLRMSEGIDFDHVITYGALNEVTPESLELYHKNFDHVILGDGSLKVVIKSFKTKWDNVLNF